MIFTNDFYEPAGVKYSLQEIWNSEIIPWIPMPPNHWNLLGFPYKTIDFHHSNGFRCVSIVFCLYSGHRQIEMIFNIFINNFAAPEAPQ